MKKCIKMGITVLKIVIWRDKLSVLWLKIWYYSSTAYCCKTKFISINLQITHPNDNFGYSYPLISHTTVKILKFGTAQTIAIIVLKIEKFDVRLY